MINLLHSEAEYSIIESMKLPDYLKREGLTQTQFGQKLNPPMTQMHLSHVINGRTRISLARALEIAEVTNGEVPVHEWIEPSSRSPLKSPANLKRRWRE